MFSRGAILSIAVVLLSSTACEQPEHGDSDFADALDNYIETVMDRFEIPGLTIAVTQGDEIAYTGAWGVRSLETGEPMRTDHVFHMASVSKPFVATAVMQLVEQGRMDLDERVATYLPYFELADERFREITVRQMLNHTSGMPDVMDYEWGNPQYDEGAAERYVRSLTGEQMIATPGERWRYSNMAFDTMGDVIAKVSGVPFETFIKENILDPLGMIESSFQHPEIREELRTTGHVWELEPVVSDVYPYNRRHAPSSTLNSNVLEMTNWAFANLNHGELNGNRILEEESYDVLWTPSAEVREDYHVGLSWFLGEYRGTRTIAHSGGDTGFSSQFLLLPDEDIGLVMGCNYSRAPLGSIRNGVLDILLDYEPEVPRMQIGMAFASVFAEQGLEAAKEFYQRAQAEEADDYVFGDRQLNSVGYFFLRADQVDQAIEILEYNVELYPEVANTYDSLGDALAAHGDIQRAIVNYSRALELDPDNSETREKLMALQAR